MYSGVQKCTPEYLTKMYSGVQKCTPEMSQLRHHDRGAERRASPCRVPPHPPWVLFALAEASLLWLAAVVFCHCHYHCGAATATADRLLLPFFACADMMFFQLYASPSPQPKPRHKKTDTNTHQTSNLVTMAPALLYASASRSWPTRGPLSPRTGVWCYPTR